MTDDDKIPFTDHLEELRSRLIVCIISVCVCFVICFAFKEKLFDLLDKQTPTIEEISKKHNVDIDLIKKRIRNGY